MKVNGSCHCGWISYEAEIDPELVGICNCTDCQVLTGTAYRVSVTTAAEHFRLLTGTPTVYVKTAESGTKRRHSFCGHCGSPVTATADRDDPPAFTVRVGGLAQKAELPPRRQIWCRSALAWARDIRAIPGVDRQ